MTGSFRSDLYVPFGEIAETRADGVLLRRPESDLNIATWEQPPAGVSYRYRFFLG